MGWARVPGAVVVARARLPACAFSRDTRFVAITRLPARMAASFVVARFPVRTADVERGFVSRFARVLMDKAPPS